VIAAQRHPDVPALERGIRVVLGKVGLDGHDRGVKVIAQGLRDAGMEVIYTGLRRTPAELAEIVLQEDAEVLGLSILSGGTVPLVRDVLAALDAEGLEDLVVFVGGIVSQGTTDELHTLGIHGVFGPGTTMAEVVSAVREQVARRRRDDAGSS
jgi:methylmalonyl-CoA mutase C-terminal domain/subunit